MEVFIPKTKSFLYFRREPAKSENQTNKKSAFKKFLIFLQKKVIFTFRDRC